MDPRSEGQENGKTKELFIEFLRLLRLPIGWDTGDTLLWEELDNGDWKLQKEESLTLRYKRYPKDGR